MKKGLGRIPKSLSWIDEVDEKIMPAEQVKEVQINTKVVANKVIPKEVEEPVVEQTVKSNNKGLAKGWVRATFIVDQEHNESIKAVAYWERMSVKEVVHEALTQYLQAKKVKPMPKKKVL